MNKKLRLTLASVALLVSATTAVLVHQGTTASAAAPCVVGQANHYTIDEANKTITGSFEVKGDAGCTQPVTVMTWYTDYNLTPSNPAYFTTQTIAHYTTQTFGVGVHELTTKLPVCTTDPTVTHSYQADTVVTDKPSPVLTPPGTGSFYEQKQADGTYIVVDATSDRNQCPPAKEPPVTPPTPVAPTTLPKTGAGSSIGLVAAVAGVAALAHGAFRRRASRNLAE